MKMGLLLNLAERRKQIEEEEAVALSFRADIVNQIQIYHQLPSNKGSYWFGLNMFFIFINMLTFFLILLKKFFNF